jgi:hypothetical protein
MYLSKLMQKFFVDKSSPKFCNFKETAQSKQLPKGRNFAQSGYPGYRRGAAWEDLSIHKAPTSNSSECEAIVTEYLH